jgi:hypothetical protein
MTTDQQKPRHPASRRNGQRHPALRWVVHGLLSAAQAGVLVVVTSVGAIALRLYSLAYLVRLVTTGRRGTSLS